MSSRTPGFTSIRPRSNHGHLSGAQPHVSGSPDRSATIVTQLVGADTHGLLALGEALRSRAAYVSEMRDNTSGLVTSLAWNGAVADDFLAIWRVSHGPKFDSAASFLITAAETIARNAAEQQGTSASAPAESTIDITAAAREHLGERITSPTFALSAYQEALRLEVGDAAFDDWLKNNGKSFRLLGEAAVGISFMSNFLEDAAQHPDLPTDERIVHAIGEVALKYAADKGISQAMQWAGMAIAGVFTAGAGVLVGRAVGWLAGQVATAGFHYLDDQYQVTDKGADLMLEGYRNVRDNPDPYLRSIPGIGPAIVAGTDAWAAAAEVAPVVAEFGHNLSEATATSREAAGEAIEHLLNGTIALLVD
jgi:hypothetical protein